MFNKNKKDEAELQMRKSKKIEFFFVELNPQKIKKYLLILETCMLPSDEGLCHESMTKYYFDRTKRMCIPFEYTGKFK